jgi:glycosyltransferase involved in cell wall biosynthesis
MIMGNSQSLPDTLAPTYTVTAYTCVPWTSAMAMLRLVDPLHLAGIRLIQGNQGVHISPEAVNQADLVIIQRDFPRMGVPYTQVIEQARRLGKPIVYETDDALLNLPLDHSHRGDYESILLPLLHAVIDADAVTTSTATLVDSLRPLNPNIWLLPNYLDDAVWITDISPVPQPPPLIIGYMGGETHLLDLVEITPVLLKILSRYESSVRLRFWGGCPPQQLLDHPQVEWLPFNQNDYTVFAHFFAAQYAHVFIAPMRDNPFNRGKSNLKYLEYSLKSVPGVYSNLPMYAEVIRNGENGLLAGTLDEWETHLIQLIDSPNLRYQMGQQARQTVLDTRLLSRHSSAWLTTYQQILAAQPRPPFQPGDWQTQVFNVMHQFEQHQTDLEAKIELLERAVHFQTSRTWMIAKKLQSIRGRLVPTGSQCDSWIERLLSDNDGH